MRISDWSSDVCSSDLAEAVHGLSIQFLSDKPLFASCIDDPLAFLGDAAMVAHNAAFDFGFVNAELARAGRPALDMVRMCCTVQMARKLHPGAKHSRSEEHTSELQSLMRISYAVFCLKKKK